MNTELKWPPNSWMAEKMGYSISGVSRLRGGRRSPTLDTMSAVEEAFGWSRADQIDKFDRWLKNFSKVAMAVYKKEMGETE